MMRTDSARSPSARRSPAAHDSPAAHRIGADRQVCHLWLVLGLVGSAACAPGASRPTVSDLEGAWQADLTHNGQRSSFAIEFEADSAGSLSASISIPAIDVWSLPIGGVRLVEDTVAAGILSLVYDRSGPLLRGKLPSALVPVHEIPLRLRPIHRIERPPDRSGLIPRATPVWVYDTEAPIWAGVAVSQHLAFVGGDDGVVGAIDPTTGVPRWKFSTGGAIRAAPVAYGGSLFVHSDDGSLYRLEADTGRLEWKASVADTATQRVPYGSAGFRYDQYASSPVIAEGRVFLGHSDGTLRAFDLGTGEERWAFPTAGPITATPVVHGGRVLFGSFDGSVYALDVDSGEEVWRFETGAAVSSSVGLFGDYAIVGSRSYDLLALVAEAGAPAWTYYYWFSWVESSPTIRDGVVYIGSSDAQRLNALDAATGRLLWAFDTGGAAWGRPAVADEAVFIGAVGVADYIVSHRAGFFAVERETGRGLWRFDMPRPDSALIWGFASSPAAVDGIVVVGGLDGRVYAFDQRRTSDPSQGR